MPESVPRLRMEGVAKRFGGIVAVDGVGFEVLAGEVHALVGENGAGKSTLMKILSGAILPDAGSLFLDGEPYRPKDPREGRARGIAMIYQELNLAHDLTVEANICLGIEPARRGFLRHGEIRRLARDALAELGDTGIEPDETVGRLGPGPRQLVEIARALVSRARIVVLDEPTSSLSAEDTRLLFAVVRRLAASGVSVVYISHFLEEVQEIADRFTVLRDGRVVGSGRIAETPLDRIIALMVGREVQDLFPHIPHEIGEPILDVNDLWGKKLPRGAGVTLHRGEVLGIFGLVGAGRTEFLRAIYGLDPVRSGRIRVAGIEDAGRLPHERIRQGVGLLSEDRKLEGLAVDQSIADNLTYGRMEPFSRFGVISPPKRRRIVEEWMARLSIRGRGPHQAVSALSGGNQQKVALARILYWEADVVLLDEPTRGVDVGSKVEIYRLIGDLAVRGKAVVFVSSYLPELLGVCDRIATMHRGELSVPLETRATTPEAIMALATGTREDAA